MNDEESKQTSDINDCFAVLKDNVLASSYAKELFTAYSKAQ